MGQKGSQYLKSSVLIPSTRNRRVKTFFSGLFSVLSVFLILMTVVGAHIPQVFADEDEKAREKVSDAFNKEYEGLESDEIPEQAYKNWLENKDENTFSYIFQRLLSLSYMNDTKDASAGDGGEKLDQICDVNHEFLGTPLYHNCDIPNIVTEFAQDVVSLLDDDGVYGAGATKRSAKVFLPEIGLPSSIVEEGVPVKASSRNKKYTGLELYGYNLRFSSYAGEWDHIKVMTSARAMSNFGFMDKLFLGGRSIVNGVVSGFERGAANFGESFKKGDVIGMITAPFSGFIEGFASGTLRTILDSSDLNVHNSYGWYRVTYPNTLYNARPLTQIELAVIAQKGLVDYLTSMLPEEATMPKALEDVTSPPDKLKTSKVCTIHADHIQGNTSSVTKEASSEEACKSIAESHSSTAPISGIPSHLPAYYTWDDDNETITQWKARHKKWFDAVEEYNIDIELADSGSAVGKVNKFITAWPEAHTEASETFLDEDQDKKFNEWKTKMLTSILDIRNWFTKKEPERNFNAPYMRLVCIDSEGKDLKSGDEFVYLYDADGNANPACGETRPPIQDGLYGNGYKSNEHPLPDTRREMFSFDLMDILQKLPLVGGSLALVDAISGFGIKVSGFATRISNTFLNLSMTPILDFFGINDLIVSLIESFRESVFMALAVLVVGVSAVMIMIQVMRRRSYREGFKNIAIMILTFIIAVITLQYPKELVDGMDNVPSYLQSVVMATVFNVGTDSEDILCTADTEQGQSVEGFDGASLGFEPENASRVLMCENWRVFMLSPWVHTQWGTSFSNLNDTEMKNSNSSLVGTGAVDMGNGQSMNNWALYQIDVASSGTSTTHDPKNPTGQIDPNFYRLVDLQFGPKNGAKSDDSYAAVWSGAPISRLGSSFLGAIMSIVGAVVVIAYSINLIQVSVVSSLMLIALPFVLLIGLHPTSGRGKLRQYLGRLLSLVAQRIILVLLLSIMFTLMIATANSTDNFFQSATLTIVLAIIFMFYRKDLLKLFSIDTAKNMAQGLMNNPAGAAASVLPRSTQNHYDRMKAGARGYAGGYVAGVALEKSLSPKSLKQAHHTAKEAANQASRSSSQSALNKIRRGKGFGWINMIDQTRKDVPDRLKEEMKGKAVESGLMSDVNQSLSDMGGGAVIDIDTASDKQMRRIGRILRHADKAHRHTQMLDDFDEEYQQDLADYNEDREKTGRKGIKTRDPSKFRKVIRKVPGVSKVADQRRRTFRNARNWAFERNMKAHNKKYAKEEYKAGKKRERRETFRDDLQTIAHPMRDEKKDQEREKMVEYQVAKLENPKLDYEKFKAEEGIEEEEDEEEDEEEIEAEEGESDV